MRDTYITAVLDELKAGTELEQVLVGLKKTLKKRGHLSLYASILRGVVRVLEADGAETIVVTVARITDQAKHQAAIAAALATLGASANATVSVDSSLIGGYVVEANHQRIDASYKAKLVTLYRTLTK